MGSVALEGFGSGGGAALNFKVKDYATEEQLMAATGKVNEIGIITSTPMTGWYFAAEQPEMQPGEVWISTGTSSTVAFNALKKGGTVMVYPISAKQMGQDGVLVDVTAKSWQNGEWVDWITFTYIVGGEEQVVFTGANCSCSYSGSVLSVKPNGANNSMKFWAKDKYDLTGISVISMSGISGNSLKNDYAPFMGIFTAEPVFNGRDNNAVAKQRIPQNGNAFTDDPCELNVSEYDGLYYIGCFMESSDANPITIPEWKIGG